MKIFMGNPCGYGNCMRTDCEKCCHYTPTMFGVKVPKWLGNIGFWIEWQMFKLKEIGEKKAIRKWQKSIEVYEDREESE